MIQDPYTLRGWVLLFRALNTPCECERGISHDCNGKTLNCLRHPFPYPGYRWYIAEVASTPAQVERCAARIMSRVRPPMRGRRVRVA